MKRPRRNDPCPCGSGKKYKRCCLERDVALPVPNPEPRSPAERRRVRVSTGLFLTMVDVIAPGSLDRVVSGELAVPPRTERRKEDE